MSFIKLGLAIASPHPKKLAEFYALATNGKLVLGTNQQHWTVELWHGLTIHLYKPSQNEPIPEKGRAMSICLEQEASISPSSTIKEWVRVLIACGAKLIKEPTLQAFGVEAWMSDPEGNDFLIFVPSP